MTDMDRPAPESAQPPAVHAPAEGAAEPNLAVRIARLWPAFPDPFRRAPLRWRRRLFRADRILGGAFAAFAGLSLLWTATYAVLPVPATFLMAQRALESREVRYHWRSLDRISPDLVRAVIAAEDARFCDHPGFDYDAIQTALREAESGGRLRGASTISQQTAKNAFLFPQRSWIRKGLETWFTMLTEAIWTKRRTMEVYLNVAEWGDGLFGAEAAAQARFGKSAAELTEREAALLAAVLSNPHEWRVDPPGPYVSGRAASLQRRLRDVQAGGLESCVL